MCNKEKSKWRTVLVRAILLGGVAVTGYYSASVISTVPMLSSKRVNTSTAQTTAELRPVDEVVNISDDPKPVVTSAAYRMLNKSIREELKHGRPTYALKLLSTDPMAKKIKNAEYDQLRATIAQSYLVEGMTQKAFEVAKVSATRSKKDAPEASWVGGIAAWKLQNYNKAAEMFSVAADSSQANAWLKSASAFWASRAFGKIHNVSKSDHYMEVASNYPRTFYGLIALKSLDRDYEFNWDKPNLKWKHKRSLESSDEVQDAISLSQKGDMESAIAKLSKAGWLDGGHKQQQLLAYVLDQDAPALALHLGRQTKNDKGGFYDAALYPETSWDPDQGYEIDRALVNALIRQESRFNPSARNASGASGLMQLMPSTASYMAKGIDVSLTHPQTNISVGQKYVRHLLMDPAVNNDLFYMAIAYNAGPGNLARWKKQYKSIDDPLLFIESIPSAETRGFVQRVMVNYWIYRIHMGKDNPSLDAVVSHKKTEYVDADTHRNAIEIALGN